MSADLITPHILPDHALKNKGEGAGFLFDEYAKTFARLIAESRTATPIVLGISGKWGSGKTTLLKMIKDHLETTEQIDQNFSKLTFVNPTEEARQFRRCRTVWFNAWKYADEDELLVALVRVIVQTMYADEFIVKAGAALFDPFPARHDVINTVLSWFAIKNPLIEVKPNTGLPVETPFSKKTALLDQFSEVLDHLGAVWVHQDLSATKIKQREGVIAVFIDDLDRCLPEKAIQVLEAIKLFLDREGIAFVLAADEDMVRQAIEAHYERQKVKDQRADDYLEKIFQVRFRLPPLSNDQARDYLAGSLNIDDPTIKNNHKLIVAVAETNPRQIKTFVNYLETGWSILQNSGQATEVSKADFLYWLALTRVGEKFCEKVRRLLLDKRLDYIKDAIEWANGKIEKAAEYKDWEGFEYQRLREVLKAINFSPQVTPRVLDGFIYWNAAEAIEAELKDKAKAAEAIEEERKKEEDLTREFAQVRSGDEIALSRGGEFKRIPPDPFNPEYWISIPAGSFVMGSRDDNNSAQDNERPQHSVTLKDYRLARYPVTNENFAAFVSATQYKTGAEEKGSSNVWNAKANEVKDVKGANWAHPQGPQSDIEKLSDHPVVHVNWQDAVAYCQWLTQELQTQKIITPKECIRLPSEAEWEKAARGEFGKEYPWGDAFEVAKCNTRESGIGGTSPVGKFSPLGDSPYGLADMAGNVWEWVSSAYKAYPYDATDDREDPNSKNALRVLRGGSWNLIGRNRRAAYRSGVAPASFNFNIGFRVAFSPSRV